MAAVYLNGVLLNLSAFLLMLQLSFFFFFLGFLVSPGWLFSCCLQFPSLYFHWHLKTPVPR